MIEVTVVDLAACAATLEDLERREPRLSPAEQRRATAMVDPKRRTDWRAAHIALRLALERVAGHAMRSCPYEIDSFGRPSLPAPAPAFSLSHTTGLAVVAVAARGQVGVDVEARRQIVISPERRARLVAAGIAAGGGTPADAVAAWTRLEALGKARGTGVGPVLTAIRLRGAPSRQVAAEAAAELVEQAGLRIVDLPLPRSHAGALAASVDLGGYDLIRLPDDADGIAAFVAARNAVDLDG